VVGVIFGFFHVSLFRILPTALLGFLLTYVVLFSGSIYPAMLWHTLNNALGLVPFRLGLIPEDFAPSAWWALPAAVGLAASMWILWRAGPERRKRDSSVIEGGS
jgi:sodium transport system permease protein